MANQRPGYQSKFSYVQGFIQGYNQGNSENFVNEGRGYYSNPAQRGRGNFGYQGRGYSSYPAQRGRGHFGYQGGAYSSNYDEDYSLNQYEGTSFNRNRDYSYDNNHASRFNQYPTSSSSINLGNAYDEQKVFSDDKFTDQSQFMSFSQASRPKQNRSGQAQRGNFEMEDSSDEGGDFEEEDYNDEEIYPNTGQDWNEDEYCGSDDEYTPEKVNAFVPRQDIVEKFKYFPPSAEEMGHIFKGMVIYFFYKIKSVQEKNPFVIICDSFRLSDRFEQLQIEDGYNRANKYIKYCTIRWNGMMMVRGVGYSGNLKEPRVVAGVELINKLAMTCYILKMKDSYYSKAAVKEVLERGTNESNTVRIIQEHEAPNMESAKKHIYNFFKDDNDHELLFPFRKYTPSLKGWAKHNGYECRFYESSSVTVLGVSIRRTPQYWRDKILASGRMENERFQLVPPYGIGNKLLEGFDISTVIGKLRKTGYAAGSQSNEECTKYANNDQGLNIAKAVPPWEKRGNRPRGGGRGGFRRTSKKMKRMERAVKNGKPVTLKHLSKKQKKAFRKKFL